MVAAILYHGFRRVHGLAAEVTVAQLEASSHQLRGALQSSAARLRRELATVSRASALERASSAFATEADIAAAQALLESELMRLPQSTKSVSLWSKNGRLLASVGDTSLTRHAPPKTSELATARNDTVSAVIAPLFARGDSIFLSVVARIRDQSGGLQGVFVEVRHLAQNTASLALLRGVVGADARILIGNAGDDLWSDFTSRVPVAGVTADSSAGSRVADGVDYLHSIEPISGTPWRILVEVPKRWATARAGSVIIEIGAAAALMLLLGAVLVWVAIHRSLRPLEEVTAGVERLAHGELGQRVPVSTDDELGTLAQTFNAMADKVEESTTQLAARATAFEAANEDLKESREQYRQLVDHLPDGILVHRSETVTFANARAAELLGATGASDLIGRPIAELVEPSGGHARVQGNRELKVRRPDGRRLIVEATDIAMGPDGESGTQTILHDVTQKRVLEEELRHAQKMDAVGRLAGGVAHDFNNILTVIDAYAEFASQPEADDNSRAEDLREIKAASATAARLTRQLLAFSRKQVLSPVELDLNSIVAGLRNMLGRVIGQKITIEADLANPLWTVRADAGYLEQVLMNLAVNARDAMPNGGTLRFHTANFEASPDYRTPAGELIPEGQYALLTVEDSGVGIPEEVQERVFEPFFTTKPAGQGTGLGLSTVYGIVKQSGGFIWLYSEVGHGTSFKILLPRSTEDKAEESANRTSEHQSPSVSARILLVEDQAAVRNAIARALRNVGFVVTEAADAETAERFLEDGEPTDLIVTDMVMGGKTGAELAKGVIASGRNVPIIIMSGYSEDFSSRAWQLPAEVVFVDKPVAPTDMIRLINKLLSH
jgi:PAS domain S-box-containing protein